MATDCPPCQTLASMLNDVIGSQISLKRQVAEGEAELERLRGQTATLESAVGDAREALDAINDAETAEVVLTLVTLDHADWAAPVRLVNDVADFEHDGETYTAAGFQVAMPDQAEDRNAAMRWTLQDVDHDVAVLLRTTNDVIDIEVSYVLASDPDTVQAGPFEAEIRQAELRYGSVSGALVVYPVMEEVANASFRFSTGPIRARG